MPSPVVARSDPPPLMKVMRIWAGIAGCVLLAIGIGWALVDRLSVNAAGGCRAPAPSAAPMPIGVLDVDPIRFGLGGKLCIVVNLIDGKRLGDLTKARDAASADLAAAEAALRAAKLTASPDAPTVAATTRQRDDAVARSLAAETAWNEFVKPSKLTLFLDGRPAPLTQPTRSQADRDGLLHPLTIEYRLVPDPDATTPASKFWRELLAQPGKGGIRQVRIGVAAEGELLPLVESARRSETESYEIILYDKWPRLLAGAAIFLMFLGLTALAQYTALLRDGDHWRTAYSLARVQMAMWVVLSLAGFVYLALVTGQYVNLLPPSTFVLIGIAGATAGAARVIDDPARLRQGVAAPRDPNARPTGDFLTDLAAGYKGGSVELHRLQMIAWTIVLGGIYAWNILTQLTLTDFDPNLLALAGVVSGLYVGLKTQETPAAAPSKS